MKIVLVRHGEPDYTECIRKGYIGLGLNLAPLSELGCKQAEAVAYTECMKGAQLIVCSPYTRALQTAAVISRINNIPLEVNEDLHEWIPDLTFRYSLEYAKDQSDAFLANDGRWPNGKQCTWESIDLLSHRVLTALNIYRNYNKIILVSHAVVLYHLTGLDTLPYCCVAEIEYCDNFKPSGWFKKKCDNHD